MSHESFDTLDNQPTIPGEPGGQVLSGRYKIIRKLGEGGMGTVYLAEDTELNMPVAVKVLPTLLANNKRAIDNLRREARTALRLTHPNIVRLHTFESDEAIKYLVMEYVDGGNLEEKISSAGTLSVDVTIKMSAQIAAGLDYAHSQNVLHRDIKPANIMLTKDGQAKLADFGIARQLKDSMTRITGKETSGTLLYMAPEQFRGGEPDHRSDIYSLAASIYECICGHPPFWQGSIEYQIMNEEPAPLDKLEERQNAMLLKALSKKVDERPATASDLVAMLKVPQEPSPRAESSIPRRVESAQLEKAERKEQAPPAKRRSRTSVILVILALCVVLVVFGLLKGRHNEEQVFKGDIVKPPPKAPRQTAVEPTNQISSTTEQVEQPRRTPVKKPGKALLPLDLGGGVAMEFVWIPSDSFTMGSPTTEKSRSSDEGPQHLVRISKAFYMGKTEVTRGQFSAFVRASGYKTDAEKEGWAFAWQGNAFSKVNGANWRNIGITQTDDHPVVGVSWNDAKAFCDWLSVKAYKTCRLPTEAEWEYGCRAGSSGAYCFGDSDSGLDSYAWYSSNSGVSTHPVGEKNANTFGLYDMHGNVWEWCSDYYDSDYYSKSPASDPQGSSTGGSRVVRGGSWNGHPRLCRSAYRSYYAPDYRSGNRGFRVVVLDF